MSQFQISYRHYNYWDHHTSHPPHLLVLYLKSKKKIKNYKVYTKDNKILVSIFNEKKLTKKTGLKRL